MAAPVAAPTVVKRDLPAFVLAYAPVAYLHSSEIYLPSSLAAHIANTHPVDGSGNAITPPTPLTLENLDSLNAFANSGQDVYLTSNEGIQSLPPWFQGIHPDATGSTGSSTAAGCVIITVSKPNNVLDAFYFYFYAYNQGNWVLGDPKLEFGDHVGDWEHTMIRFVDSVPQAMWYSQHAGGEAFTYSALEKEAADGKRPVVYVGKGTHANYAIHGVHDHTFPGLNLPVGPLEDHTDRGIFWDPVAGALVYDFDIATQTFTAVNGQDPTGFLNFGGHWGDNQLADNVRGQIDVFGQRKYVAGPTGPKFKSLDRTNVCPPGQNCTIRTVLVP